MNNLKRIAIVLVAFSLLIVLSLNYTGNDVLKRAIEKGSIVLVATGRPWTGVPDDRHRLCHVHLSEFLDECL